MQLDYKFIIQSIIIFTFLVLTNITGEFINKDLYANLINNKLILHIITFFILVIFVEIGIENNANVNKLLLNSFAVYFLFLISFNFDINLFVIFILFMCAKYILFLYKKYENKEFEKVNKILNYGIIILYIYGISKMLKL